MKIAFIGDIVGRPGRDMVKNHLKKIKEEYKLDFVIANYENASHGFGLSSKNADELVSFGIDCMTGGNHTWDKKEIVSLFDEYEILRPHNYPQEVLGTGCKVYDIKDEDIHMAIETRLTQIIGDVGGRLHTARSRNDQVATDFALYVQDKTILLQDKLKVLITTLVNIASKHTQTLIPGMTHLQHAQPINFGFHLLAYANMFKRDYERFIESYKRRAKNA